MAEVVKGNGGRVSYRLGPGGTQTPYELNITYVDAILADSGSDRVEKFLASQAIQYVLPGVPATYIHSLLGSRNWIEGVKQTGQPRTINREKLQTENLLAELKDPASFRSRVFYPYLKMIKVRSGQKAFHPNASFEILELDPRIFAIRRAADDQIVYALTNISAAEISLSLSEKITPGPMTDLISAETVNTDLFTLKPYQYVWLTADD